MLRGCAEASTLEEQFRFLWRLLDRDADGILSRADVACAMALQRARLGWDEAAAAKWVQFVLDTARARDREGGRGLPGASDLRAALGRSAQLRTVLMAQEPAAR